jgi:hypothetical protein
MKTVYDYVKEFQKKYVLTISWFRAKAHSKIVQKYLDEDEKVLYAFIAQKNSGGAYIFQTAVFCLTNKRIIIGQKRLVWGAFMSTITPDLYNDMQIYQGLIWGKVTIDTVKEVICFSKIDKKALDEIETKVSSFMMDEKKKYKGREE